MRVSSGTGIESVSVTRIWLGDRKAMPQGYSRPRVTLVTRNLCLALSNTQLSRPNARSRRTSKMPTAVTAASRMARMPMRSDRAILNRFTGGAS